MLYGFPYAALERGSEILCSRAARAVETLQSLLDGLQARFKALESRIKLIERLQRLGNVETQLLNYLVWHGNTYRRERAEKEPNSSWEKQRRGRGRLALRPVD